MPLRVRSKQAGGRDPSPMSVMRVDGGLEMPDILIQDSFRVVIKKLSL